MKICVIICELNPFHNGHEYLLSRAKELSGCDTIVCLTSGAFTQRGEICNLDPYTRARHACLGGADIALALPVYYSVAPAEVFARGAIKLAANIGEASAVVFGCESGESDDFLRAADILLSEDEKFKKALYEGLDGGESYIKSYCAAFTKCGGERGLLSSPNNILGVEYAKAILRSGAKLKPVAVRRAGSGYSDTELKGEFSSAAAIRANPSSPLLEKNMPKFSLDDFIKAEDCGEKFKNFEQYALLSADKADLKRIYGCGEGLENKLKENAGLGFEDIVKSCTTKRYSAARIRRILCANALKLYADECEKVLSGQPYFKPLAIKSGSENRVFAALSQSDAPVLTRERQTADFSDGQKLCLAAELFAYKTASAVYGKELYYYTFERV